MTIHRVLLTAVLFLNAAPAFAAGYEYGTSGSLKVTALVRPSTVGHNYKWPTPITTVPSSPFNAPVYCLSCIKQK